MKNPRGSVRSPRAKTARRAALRQPVERSQSAATAEHRAHRDALAPSLNDAISAGTCAAIREIDAQEVLELEAEVHVGRIEEGAVDALHGKPPASAAATLAPPLLADVEIEADASRPSSESSSAASAPIWNIAPARRRRQADARSSFSRQRLVGAGGRRSSARWRAA
jgi:hypothetical protein